MKKKIWLAVMAAILFAPVAHGQTQAAQRTRAQRQITWAQEVVKKHPESYQSYNTLALALTQRGRETADPIFYARAEKAIGESFRLAPDNFEGEKIRVWLLLEKHEFAQALKKAQALNRRAPDDVLVYGYLADAHIHLGNYEEAEEAAQWMLDLQPGNVPGLTRGAHLRELFGDIEGAIEFMIAAYQRTPPSEAEERAWILNQVAHLELMRGGVDRAEQSLLQALQLYPNYHYALANLAKVRTAQEKLDEAVSLLQRRYGVAPHPENLYEVAKALEKAGRLEEAEKAYAKFEEQARAEKESADNSNRELIFYYADQAKNSEEALRLSQHEVARRRDVYTLDAYAWALFANGLYDKARQQIETALAVGIRDAQLFCHAAAIAAKQGDQAAVEGYRKQLDDLRPSYDCSRTDRGPLAAKAR